MIKRSKVNKDPTIENKTYCGVEAADEVTESARLMFEKTEYSRDIPVQQR